MARTMEQVIAAMPRERRAKIKALSDEMLGEIKGLKVRGVMRLTGRGCLDV